MADRSLPARRQELMQILLLTHYFEPENGAPQRRWSSLIEWFISRGHAVHVIAPPPHYPAGRLPPEFADGYRPGTTSRGQSGAVVHRVAYLRHRSDILTRTCDHLWVAASTVFHARRLARRGIIAPDIVVATAPGMPTLIAGHAVARYLGKPLVAEMRDAWPDLVSHVPGMSVGPVPTAVIKRKIHHTITDLQRRASVVVTTTESFAAILRNRGVRDVRVIRNGTLLERYAQIPPVGDGHAELRVLYMGTVGRSQGLDALVRAAARAKDLGVNLHVRIVGHGAEVRRLRALNLSLNSPTDILEGVAAADVFGHYAWADTTVVSLRDWEPFKWTVPSKLYELMATGKHVTGIVAGEAARLIAHTGVGDVVDPGDDHALAKLLKELAENRSRLTATTNGRAWVAENVDYEVLADQYLGIIAEFSTA